MQEQLNHRTLFDRYNYLISYHMQTLGKMKFKYTNSDSKLKSWSLGKYMTNLLPMEANSDFFIDLYREIAKFQVIVETFMSDYFIR